jgi:predicted alpha/beta-fold hydrolase
LATLKTKAEESLLKCPPGTFDIEKIRACDTIGAFDDAFIAPVYGFADKFDYYRQCAAKRWLHQIRVPVVAINAIDDPFVEASLLPTAADVGEVAPVRVVFHPHGGHCGFMTDQTHMLSAPFPAATTAATTTAPTLTTPATPAAADGAAGATLVAVPVPAHGWLAEELSRALLHTHASLENIQN